MSRLHVRFVRITSSPEVIEYDIVSPDFSENSIDTCSLGVVRVDLKGKDYEFRPSTVWENLGFVDLPLLTAGRPDCSKLEGVNYAHRIHSAITAMIREGEFV